MWYYRLGAEFVLKGGRETMILGRVFRKGIRALGKMLVDAGLVGKDVVARALDEQERLREAGRPHKPLGQILVETQRISEEELRRLLRDQVDALLIHPRTAGNGIWVLELFGYVDAHTHDLLDEALSLLIEEGKRRIVLDCANLDYMNSDGVGPIVSARRLLRGLGGDIRVSGLHDKAATVFEVLGMDRFISVHADVAEAVEALSKASLEREPVKTAESEPKRFVASVRGKSFHREDCSQARRISRGNKVHYVSEAEALRSGRKPCSRCLAGH